MSRSTRNGRPLTILALDLDDLKQVNDRFGHPAGDELIRTFAERLNKAIRGSDLAVRLGGGGILVLLPECKADEARQVLSRLSGLEVEFRWQSVEVSFSAGWTDFAPGDMPTTPCTQTNVPDADQLYRSLGEAICLKFRLRLIL